MLTNMFNCLGWNHHLETVEQTLECELSGSFDQEGPAVSEFTYAWLAGTLVWQQKDEHQFCELHLRYHEILHDWIELESKDTDVIHEMDWMWNIVPPQQ